MKINKHLNIIIILLMILLICNCSNNKKENQNNDKFIMEKFLEEYNNRDKRFYEYLNPLGYAITKRQLGIALKLAEDIELVQREFRTREHISVALAVGTDIENVYRYSKNKKKFPHYKENEIYLLIKKLIQNGATVITKDNKPLSLACIQGYKNIVKLLIKKGVPVNGRDSSTDTPLHIAARNCHKEIVEILINNQAEVISTGYGNNTILHNASFGGLVELCELCISKGEEINCINDDGLQPIHMASYRGNIDILELLKSKGANLEASGKGGIKPIHIAVNGGNIEAVIFYLKNKVNINAIYKPLRQHHLETIGSNSIFGTPLFIAIRTDNSEIVKLLENSGAQLQSSKYANEDPLWIVVKDKNIKAIEYIIKKGVNFKSKKYVKKGFSDYEKESIIEYISEVCNKVSKEKEIILLFLKNGYKINEEEIKHLSIPAIKEIFPFLDNKSVLINKFSQEKIYEITIDPVILEYFLKNGLNPNLKVRNKPLLWFCVDNDISSFNSNNKKIKYTSLLMKYGANINIIFYGENILHECFQYTNCPIEVIDYIIKNNINLNSVNRHNETPLHVALSNAEFSEKEMFKIIKKMISHGVNLKIKNKWGETVFDLLKSSRDIYPQIYDYCRRQIL